MAKARLFISHSSGDAEVAREVRAILEAAGYACWMAPDDVIGSGSWIEQILEAIKSSAAMIVLVSDRANRSKHVSREVALALDREHPVLPIRIEAVGPEGALEWLLMHRQRLDAFPLPIASHADAIVRRIQAMLGEPASVASPGGPPTGTGPRARKTLFGSMRAWAGANTPVAVAASAGGALAFLFVTWSVLGGGGGPTPSPSPSGVVVATAPPSADPTPTATSVPIGTPAPTATSYFTAAEQALLGRLPVVTGSAVNCRRDDAPWTGAVASVVCDDPDGRSNLLYYGSFSQMTDMEATFAGLMAIDGVNEARADGVCQDPDPAFGSRTWLHVAGGETQGQLGCYEFGQGVKYAWTFNERLILSAWVAPTNKRGYEFWSNWVLATKPTP